MYIRPHLDYGDVIYHNRRADLMDLVERIQYKAALIVTGWGDSFFGISDKHGIRLLIKIRVSFSDLRAHRFSHNFNCVSPVCNCGRGDETTVHYMLRCLLLTFEHIPFFDSISDVIHSDVTVLPDEH